MLISGTTTFMHIPALYDNHKTKLNLWLLNHRTACWFLSVESVSAQCEPVLHSFHIKVANSGCSWRTLSSFSLLFLKSWLKSGCEQKPKVPLASTTQQNSSNLQKHHQNCTSNKCQGEKFCWNKKDKVWETPYRQQHSKQAQELMGLILMDCQLQPLT